ncbi:type IVB secretion system protein IcmH/DotU [Niveispirillum sp. KHB5.9]|uniref:type IVB secretion system protein IcmH/DotU n=1 Tax=Niveispirillum sp. KHB5.9 TaxID=3400269 RepID=UPI003A8B3E76
MNRSSPFDNDHTHVQRPNPGGRVFTSDEVEPQRQTGFASATDRSDVLTIDRGPPPRDLAEAAIPILLTVSRCRAAGADIPVDALRQGLVAAMKDFDDAMRDLQVPADRAGIAHYLLCETVDEMLQNTRWGQAANWDHAGLVAIFHSQARGGAHFYAFVNKMLAKPQANIDLLILAYNCLSLGFRGNTRLDGSSGKEQAEKKRREILDKIRPHLTVPDTALSPHWKGAPTPRPDAGRRVPLPIIALILLAVPVMAYVAYALLLVGPSDDASKALADIRVQPPRIVPRPPPPVPPQQLAAGQRLRTFLEREISEGKVTVEELADRIIVRIVGEALFPVGNADVSVEYRPVIGRIAEALLQEAGSVEVEGHTDSLRIRTLRYPSNWELSNARAQSVAAMLRPVLGTGRPIATTGYADTRPRTPFSGSDDSRNRRVEIVLMKDGN